MTGETPTPAQQRVLDLLREIGADGWSVTIRELCDRGGIASLSTAHTHLRALVRLGLVEQHPRSARGGYRPAGERPGGDVVSRACSAPS